MSKTGDLRNNLLKTQAELRHIRYAGPFDVYGASKGDPAAFLPVIHFILLDYSHILARHFAAKNYELYGKKDARFMESVYRLLRDEFGYRPQITREQFFSMGFAERKLIFVGDLIRLSKTLHVNLARNIAKKQKIEDSKENRDVEARKRMDIFPTHNQSKPSSSSKEGLHSSDNFIAPQGLLAAQSYGRPPPSHKILPNNVAIVGDQYSPERGSAFRQSRNSAGRSPRKGHGKQRDIPEPTLPFRNTDDSYHHQYHEDDSQLNSEDLTGGATYRILKDDPDILSERRSQLQSDTTTLATRERQIAFETSLLSSTSVNAPPQVQRHHLQYQYTGTREDSTELSVKQTAGTGRGEGLRQPEGSTIYEPAEPPAPAAPPESAPQYTDTSYQSQQSFLKIATPIPKSGFDDTFLTDASARSLHSPKYLDPKEPLRQDTRIDEDTAERPHQTTVAMPQSMTISQDQGGRLGGLSSDFPFLTRSWVAPTAPPANASPIQPQAAIPQHLEVHALFDNFMRLFAAKEEELRHLRNRLETLESSMGSQLKELTTRVSALETHNLTNGVESKRAVEMGDTVGHQQPQGNSAPVEDERRDLHSSSVHGMERNGCSDKAVTDTSTTSSSRQQSVTLTSTLVNNGRAIEMHQPQTEVRSALSQSVNAPPVHVKSAEQYIRSIQERMQQTTQFLKERTKVTPLMHGDGRLAQIG
ncbi:uncharacterized protein SPPG_05778 [Spizellomyces punctatus DAOM BR117]|uniref:Centrosomal protein of 44 kDa n=1 Tax=Spizellomyces punctatus (strain DAOM BR117) TaxID=645134 RepID=A0A0L0HB39_SPIPD|nr:uncharacterized protein SPPG_05778 [Spizellomyces punctatus DAOM BR117]KNC98800.1 hypothetical protein SPPG_05778 [Spizellomyces punctatus DAOM BR117]|eukprot:XP_016606840.1 hypothetical protein SPPG_05778 [Spizellomyces punctatus DAOM BR117]